MIDREKVIKAAEICLEHIDENDCPQECPYFEQCSKYERRVVFQPLMRDTLALLKEQEAVVAHWDDDTGHWIEGDRDGIDRYTRTTGEMIDTFRCSWCGFYQYWKTPFCPNYGAKMKSR